MTIKLSYDKLIDCYVANKMCVTAEMLGVVQDEITLKLLKRPAKGTLNFYVSVFDGCIVLDGKKLGVYPSFWSWLPKSGDLCSRYGHRVYRGKIYMRVS